MSGSVVASWPCLELRLGLLKLSPNSSLRLFSRMLVLRCIVVTLLVAGFVLLCLPCSLATTEAFSEVETEGKSVMARIAELEASNEALVRHVDLLMHLLTRDSPSELDADSMKEEEEESTKQNDRTLLVVEQAWKTGEYGVLMDSGGSVRIGLAKLGVSNDGTMFEFDSSVDVNGTVAATFVTGDGSGLTNLPAGAFAMNQNLQTTDSPTFAGITVTGTGVVDGVDVGAFNAAYSATAASVATNAADIAALEGNVDQDVSTTASPTFVGATLSADLVTTSTIDGVDIGAFKTAYDTHKTDYDGKVNQDVRSTASPTFVGATLSADLVTTSTIDGVDVSDLNAAHTATAAMLNQNVLTTSSPTFASITISGAGTVDGVDVSAFKADYDAKVNQDVRTTAGPSFTTVNTGNGNNELYAMDQNVLTTSSPTFAAVTAGTINTGHGANELYQMNQNVRTDTAVTFASIDTGHGANELYQMNQHVMTNSVVGFATVNTGHGNNELYAMNQAVLTTSSVAFSIVDATTKVRTDIIDEGSTGAGVTVDGVLMKDGLVDGVDVAALKVAVDATPSDGKLDDIIFEMTSGAFGVAEDDCVSAPCQNGGTCVDEFRTFSCVCMFGFIGADCSVAGAGTSAVNPAHDCLQILTVDSGAPSGAYWLLNTGTAGVAQQVYCDMTTDGGGWQKIHLLPQYNDKLAAGGKNGAGSYNDAQWTLTNTGGHRIVNTINALGGHIAGSNSLYYTDDCEYMIKWEKITNQGPGGTGSGYFISPNPFTDLYMAGGNVVIECSGTCEPNVYRFGWQGNVGPVAGDQAIGIFDMRDGRIRQWTTTEGTLVDKDAANPTLGSMPVGTHTWRASNMRVTSYDTTPHFSVAAFTDSGTAGEGELATYHRPNGALQLGSVRIVDPFDNDRGWLKVGGLQVSISGGEVVFSNHKDDWLYETYTFFSDTAWRVDFKHVCTTCTGTNNRFIIGCVSSSVTTNPYSDASTDAVCVGFSDPNGYRIYVNDAGVKTFGDSSIDKSGTSYLSFRRTSATNVRLHVYSDAAHTSEKTNSPFDFAIPASVTGMHSWTWGADTEEGVVAWTGSVDDLGVCVNGVAFTGSCRGHGLVASEPARSCQQINQLRPHSASQAYWINNAATGGVAAKVFCDMRLDGGGWQKVHITPQELNKLAKGGTSGGATVNDASSSWSAEDDSFHTIEYAVNAGGDYLAGQSSLFYTADAEYLVKYRFITFGGSGGPYGGFALGPAPHTGYLSSPTTYTGPSGGVLGDLMGQADNFPDFGEMLAVYATGTGVVRYWSFKDSHMSSVNQMSLSATIDSVSVRPSDLVITNFDSTPHFSGSYYNDGSPVRKSNIALYMRPPVDALDDCASDPCPASTPYCEDTGLGSYTCSDPCGAGETLVSCGEAVHLCGASSTSCVCCERVLTDLSRFYNPAFHGGPWTFAGNAIQDGDGSVNKMIRTTNAEFTGNFAIVYELGVSGFSCDRLGVGLTPVSSGADTAITNGSPVSVSDAGSYTFESGFGAKDCQYSGSDQGTTCSTVACQSTMTWSRVDGEVAIHDGSNLVFRFTQTSTADLFLTLSHQNIAHTWGFENMRWVRAVIAANAAS